MKILQLFSGVLGLDPRQTRFYQILSFHGEVTVCSAPPVPGFELPSTFLKLTRAGRSLPGKLLRAANLLSRRYEADIWTPRMRDLFTELQDSNFSLIVCHDALLLPLALALRERSRAEGRCALVMDAREFYPRQFENNHLWRILFSGLNDYVCRRYLPQADFVFTVSPGLARGYAEEYGVNCRLLPSLPDYHEIFPTATPERIRCIHHGCAAPGRKLELMIEAFSYLQGKATLDFMLMPSERSGMYLAELRSRADNLSNIRFIEPVPMREIVSFITAYDLGVYLLQPSNYNHRHALPNKLFEFIQARLGVVVSPVPDMADLVRRYGIGLVTADFTPEAMVQSFNNLTISQVDEFKKKSHQAARELCWENNAEILRRSLNL